MATGPPHLRDNQFALLANMTSPKRKKTKYKETTPFPQLPKCQPPNPRYIVMETSDPNKPISSYSCFAVNRAILMISKDITSISQLRDGNLLLLVNNKQTADKFLLSKELFGLCSIKCKLHQNLNFTKGTIYAPYLNNIPDEEIVSELSDQGVVSIHKFQKIIDNKTTNTGVILITFDLFHLPDKIKVSWNSVNVREYFPNPMRCKSCQKLGHTKTHCKNAPACEQCNLPPHKPFDCTRTQCANCLEEHASSSNKCTKFIQNKEILKIKIKNKCTMNEAKRIIRNTIPTTPLTSTFSSIITNNSVNKQINTENNQENIKKNENNNNTTKISQPNDTNSSTSLIINNKINSQKPTSTTSTTQLKTATHNPPTKTLNSTNNKNNNSNILSKQLNEIINKNKIEQPKLRDEIECEEIKSSEEE